MSALAAAVGGAVWYKKSRERFDEEDRVIDLEASANGAGPAEARKQTARQDERESELSR